MQNRLPQFLLISILPQQLSEAEAFENIRELISLVESFGGEVADILLQNREVHEKGMYIGTGKVEEAQMIITEQEIDVVVLNDIVKPTQIYEFFTHFDPIRPGVQVWDRVDLILKIFARHAHTAEAQLQIQLASMRHMGPRIYGMGTDLSQQGGGIGTRGVGETNTEFMKRHYREQIKQVQKKLVKLNGVRQSQVEHRTGLGLKTISIVGYTNVGKTSLFNALTHKKKLVKNELFATLESSLGKIYLSKLAAEVLVSDTIGFIRDLPPSLIEAFKSTLVEVVEADILLQVIDLSDKDWERKLAVVEAILTEIGAEKTKRIYVFNKIDLVSGYNADSLLAHYQDFDPQFISTKKEQGIFELIKSIESKLLEKGW